MTATAMHRGWCDICKALIDAEWPTHEQAASDAAWHIHDAHPDVWRARVGERAPSTPDPRLETER